MGLTRCYKTAVAYLRGALGDSPKDFLAPKCRLKRRLAGYYYYLILRKITKSRPDVGFLRPNIRLHN